MLVEKKNRRHKPYSSITYTTGDIQKNIDHFNKMLSGKAKNTHLDGLPNVELQQAAEDAAKNVGTFASQSPDGGSSISTGDAGGSMGESLQINEAKRRVRRYYIRPQHIWASSKDELLKALIEIDKSGGNCSVYTLKNLVDNDDITKLTNKDIIYYYDDGILYDKNKVKVMDYDLAIKHEEVRDKVDVNKVSDEKFNDVYDDRMTDATIIESLSLDEAKIYIGKLGSDFELPPQIIPVNKTAVEEVIDKLEPEEEFTVGYVNPIYFYQALWNELPIFKCTEFVGYTGVDFANSKDEVNSDQQARIDRANQEITTAKSGGTIKDSTADYTLQNKLVRRHTNIENEVQNTILFYPTAAPKVCYFVKLPNTQNYIKINDEQLQTYIYDVLHKIEASLKIPVDVAKQRIHDKIWGKTVTDTVIDTDFSTSNGNKIDPKFIRKYKRDKLAVRALYTSQIYYLKTNNSEAGYRIAMLESLEKNEFDQDFPDINVFGESLVEGKEQDGYCCICGEKIDGYGNNPEPYTSAENGERCCDACNMHYVIPARLNLMSEENE